MKTGFDAFGVLLIVGGAVAAYLAASGGGPTALGLGIVGATGVFGGAVFLLVARFLGGLDQGEVLTTGLPGSALVLGVQDTGVTLNGLNAVFRVCLRVRLAGRADYETTTRVTLGRAQYGAVQPGAVVAVRVDANDPSRVAIDRDAAPDPTAFAGQDLAPGGLLIAPGGSSGLPGLPGAIQGSVRRADEIVARGARAEAVVLAVTPTGATAGQLAPGRLSDPAEADDPVVMVVLEVHPSGAATFRAQAMHRVPDGKSHALAVGNRVPVAYLPHDPARTATIDWSRVAPR